MLSKTYQSKLHIKETHVDPIYGRIFEGWISGDALNVFGSLTQNFAMTSSQAIAYKCQVEKHAWEAGQSQWITADGQPVQNNFQVEIVFDFLQN